ncbi:MAG: ATP-binding protein [Pseudomonadota bacterium]
MGETAPPSKAAAIEDETDGAHDAEAAGVDAPSREESRLRHALLMATAMLIAMSMMFSWLSILTVETEGKIREELTAIYDLQLNAQKITTLGHRMLAEENAFEIEAARLGIMTQIQYIQRDKGRSRIKLSPVIEAFTFDIDRTRKWQAYDELQRRFSALIRSADRLVDATTPLEARFALSALRAHTRSDLDVELEGIGETYEALADRMQSVMTVLQVTIIPTLLIVFAFVWFAAVKPALLGEREATARLIASERRARQLAESAETASRAKSQFLATMSHEIRTPMNGMIALIDLLRRDTDAEDRARLLEIVARSGQLLENIVNDILDFSKIEAGELALESVPFDPLLVVDQVAATHGQAARDRGLRLVTTVDRQGLEWRRGDPLRLRQILNNLVNNAIKFTEEGHVEIALEVDERGHLVMRVADTGIGMEEMQVARAFDTFSQADSSTTRRFGGSGLGLSIVRRLVDLMEGTIEIDSLPERGTMIAIALPLPVAAAERERAADPALAAGDDGIEGLRVLVADDNRTNRIVLERLLSHLGCIAIAVDSGALAVQAARDADVSALAGDAESAGAQRFDVLLLDISMPGMDGIEALHRIRAQEAAAGLPPVPAVAVTANAFEHQVRSYLAAGFAAHAPKPLRAEILRQRIVEVRASAGQISGGRMAS